MSPAIDLLEKMLDLNTHTRLNATQALAHEYVKQYADPFDEPVAEKYDSSYEDLELGTAEWKGKWVFLWQTLYLLTRWSRVRILIVCEEHFESSAQVLLIIAILFWRLTLKHENFYFSDIDPCSLYNTLVCCAGDSIFCGVGKMCSPSQN